MVCRRKGRKELVFCCGLECETSADSQQNAFLRCILLPLPKIWRKWQVITWTTRSNAGPTVLTKEEGPRDPPSQGELGLGLIKHGLAKSKLHKLTPVPPRGSALARRGCLGTLSHFNVSGKASPTSGACWGWKLWQLKDDLFETVALILTIMNNQSTRFW